MTRQPSSKHHDRRHGGKYPHQPVPAAKPFCCPAQQNLPDRRQNEGIIGRLLAHFRPIDQEMSNRDTLMESRLLDSRHMKQIPVRSALRVTAPLTHI